jgi:hypothetical protein
MKLGIQLALSFAILILGYFVFDSINSKIQFEKELKKRKETVTERLKDIRTAQIAYKNLNGEYANDFDVLINFVRTGQMPIIKLIGDAEDSLQVAQGLVIRDTTYVNLMDTLFPERLNQNRIRAFHLDSLPVIPFSGGERFALDAGEIEKNKVKVKVFEAFASYKQILKDLETENHSVKLNEGLRVGSMTEPSTSGNWE